MGKLASHLRKHIDASSTTFTSTTGPFTRFDAIPANLVRVWTDDRLEAISKGQVLVDSDGCKSVVVSATTVANRFLLELLPVPADY